MVCNNYVCIKPTYYERNHFFRNKRWFFRITELGFFDKVIFYLKARKSGLSRFAFSLLRNPQIGCAEGFLRVCQHGKLRLVLLLVMALELTECQGELKALLQGKLKDEVNSDDLVLKVVTIFHLRLRFRLRLPETYIAYLSLTCPAKFRNNN